MLYQFLGVNRGEFVSSGMTPTRESKISIPGTFLYDPVICTIQQVGEMLFSVPQEILAQLKEGMDAGKIVYIASPMQDQGVLGARLEIYTPN